MRLLSGGSLAGLRVAVVGYGNQGRAHALNLRDQGVPVVVGQRPGAGWDRAGEDGFAPMPLGEAVAAADVVMLSLPDVAMGEIVPAHVLPAAREGQTFLFAHGFAVVYGLVAFPAGVDVALVSPKGAGYGIRQLFAEGKGVPALIGVHQDATGSALERAVGYAEGIGCGRSGLLIETSFRHETETDLFGEQAVLCGGIPALLHAAFETLVAKGYPPELAYFECLHETKLIVDLIVARGIAGMRAGISDTAAWGGMVTGESVIARPAVEAILDRIQSGDFAREWIAEVRSGKPEFTRLAAAEAAHPVEPIGQELRQKMGL